MDDAARGHLDDRIKAHGVGIHADLRCLTREVLILHILNLFFCIGFEWFIFVPSHVSFDHLL